MKNLKFLKIGNLGSPISWDVRRVVSSEDPPETIPVITSENPSDSYGEGIPVFGIVTANKTATFSVIGPDSDAVTIDPDTGEWELEETDYEGGKIAYSFSFVATNSAGDSEPQVVSIEITNVFEAPDLEELSLSDSEITQYSEVLIDILGATEGSTLNGTMPEGLTLNGAARTITGVPETPDTYNIAITESLFDSANSPRVSEIPLTIKQSIPINTSTPTITGIARVGEKLTASTGTWTDSSAGYDYQWQFDDGGWMNIIGATSSTYTLQPEDEGLAVRVSIVATNAAGDSEPAYSEPTGLIAPAIPDLGALSLSEDTVTEGSPITIDILGATPGSSIAVQSGALPDGLTLDSGARTISGTPTDVDEFSFTLRETLAGSANSPRDTTLTITITNPEPDPDPDP